MGLKADRNSRKNFNLIGLGNYSVDELGMVNESYGVLTNLIGDRYIVAEESERAALNATFKQLQPISKQHRRPIIFSSLSPARLALLPDLRKYKTSKVSTKPALDDIRYRLEFLIDTDTGIDTSRSEPKTGDTASDTGIDTSDSEPDTSVNGTAETLKNTGGSSGITDDTADTGIDTSVGRYTPARLKKDDLLRLIRRMKECNLSQTVIIESLWSVEKNKAGWKQAYGEFKQVTGEA